MTYLVHYLRDNPWAIQVMQHALSLHAQVPIRLLNLVKSREVYDTWSREAESLDALQSLTDVQWKELLEFFGKRENSQWVTLPSNIHPMVEVLNENSLWRVWEHLFIARGMFSKWPEPFSYHEKNGTCVGDFDLWKSPYFDGSMQICTCRIELPRQDGKPIIPEFDPAVVLGPLFVAPDQPHGEDFLAQRVMPFVRHVRKMFKDESQVPPSTELAQQGCSRGWMDPFLFEHKTRLLGRAMRCLFNIEHTVENIGKGGLHRSTFNSLAQIAFLLNREDIRTILLTKLKGLEKYEICFPLLQRSTPTNDPHLVLIGSKKTNGQNMKIIPCGNVSDRCVRFCAQEDASEACGESTSLVDDKTKSKARFCSPLSEYEGASSTAQSSLESVEGSLHRLRLDLEHSFAQFQSGFAKQRITNVRNRLNNKFGVVSAPFVRPEGGTNNPEEENPEEKIRQLYGAVAQEVGRIFSADITVIFLYDSTEDLLVPKGLSYAPEKSGYTYEGPSREALKELMDSAGRNSDLRRQSVCYRAFDERRSIFIRSCTHDNKINDPSEERVLSGEGGSELRSVMAVPITVYGRPIGLMEIGGRKPYRFRHQNLDLAQTLCTTLVGTLLHLKEVLSGLARLSRQVLFEGPDDKNYEIMLSELARMFLAKASALYMPTENADEYRMVKWFNRLDLDELPDKEKNSIIRNKKTKDSPVQEALTTPKAPFTDRHIPTQMDKNPKWPSQAVGRKGLVEEFDWVVVIPVREIGEKRLLCGVSLYYKKNVFASLDCPLSGAWEHTVKFISYQIALLVTAIQRRQQLGADLREYLTHELKQRVDGVEQRVDDILGVVASHIPPNVWKGLEVKRNDLAAYRREFLRLMGSYDRVDFDKLVDGGPSHIFRLLTGHDDKGLPQEPKQIELRGFLNGIAHPELTKHGIRWHNSCPKEVSLVVNESALKTIFQNLLNNAGKYSTQGSTVVTEIVAWPKGKSVEIHISNIAECLQEDEEYSIFLEGYRGSNVGSRKSGRGRGLYLVKYFAQRLGGEIDISIEHMEEGKCRFDFIVVLPRSLFDEDTI